MCQLPTRLVFVGCIDHLSLAGIHAILSEGEIKSLMNRYQRVCMKGVTKVKEAAVLSKDSDA